jgi:uncharacterized protein
MKPRAQRPRPERPWWRAPIQYLLRVRPRPRHLRGSFVHRVLGGRLFHPAIWVPRRDTLANGVAIGVFAGLLPLYGLQIFASAILCLVLKANIAGAALATLISNPLTYAGLLWMQIRLGVWITNIFVGIEPVEYEGTVRNFVSFGKPLVVGSLVSAAIGAMIAYPLMHGLWAFGEGIVRRRRFTRMRRLRRQRQAERARRLAFQAEARGVGPQE